MVKAVTGNGKSLQRTDHSTGTTRSLPLDQPFQRLSFVDEICHATGVDLHDLLRRNHADGTDVTPALLDLCRQHQLSTDKPHTAAALLDRLGSHFVEAKGDRPTFIIHHPLAMSPLAKANVDKVSIFMGLRMSGK